ncbi:coiled-coil domain-containing protein 50-like [Conger conger]|uniref:coiled-coil domain-containing protein 50-like n=1 Tax=Conger conger TaxID=82655 RepID=UPI002A598C02|nr:coiled-coil domain-containing protein 50-like [Conger conger]
MADFSIDQENLPGVKQVCQDFAVLEDHCLAYTLQEQEIKSHLDSNVHKNRLLQTDLVVAKRIQEEEDDQATALAQKHQRVVEQSDSDIAQVFQDSLVRQAKQQRQQEEKDATLARKLHKQMIKEDKKQSKRKKKQQEPSHFEPYASPPPSGPPRGSRNCPPEPSRSGYPQRTGRGGQGRDRGAVESHLSQSAFYTDGGRLRGPGKPSETERAAPKKEKPVRPPPPRDQGRGEEKEVEGEGERRVGTGQRDTAHGSSRACPEEVLVDLRGSEGLMSGFEESSQRGGGTKEPQDPWDPQEEVPKAGSLLGEDRCLSQPPGKPDQMAVSNMCAVTQGVTQMDLREEELRDMEVARRLQEEELEARQADRRAAQVAQDEEIARLLMEEEMKACKSSKKWGKKRRDGEWRAGAEVAIPQSREDCEQQRTLCQKPARPPPPMHNYQNVQSSSPQPPARPEPTYRGSHDKQ